MATLSSNQLRAVLYILMNIGSGTCIVFANKMVLSVYQFHFVYALTLIHTVTTMVSIHASLLNLCPCCCDVQTVDDNDKDVALRVSASSLEMRGDAYAVNAAALQVGMWAFASVGMYQQKGLKAMQVSLAYIDLKS